MARILIIDDRPADRELLVTFLAYYGHVLFEAHDGVEGLALALVERPDLIITDIQMPAMDGYALARRIRADPVLFSTRLMFYTGITLSAEVRQIAADCEVAHTLIKPAEPETILLTVNAALDSPPPTVCPAPTAELDRTYLRLLTSALRRNVAELKTEIQARKQAESEIQRHAERIRVQAEISHTLAGVTQDYQATLDLVARHLAEVIGDGCFIRLTLDDSARDKLAALYHPDPQAAVYMRAIVARAAYQGTEQDLVERTIRTGQAVFIPALTAEQLQAILPPPIESVPSNFTITSILIVPLRAAGQAIGAIAMIRNQPDRPYTADDLTLLQDLADRAALAITNARLFRDVRAEKEILRASEERLRQVLDSLPLAAYICDAEGLITYFNTRATEIWARSPKLNHPDDRYCGSFRLYWPDGSLAPYDQCWMAVAVNEGQAIDGKEIIIERPDGSRRSVLAYTHPLRDPSNRLVGAVNMLIDITERNQIEAERADLFDSLLTSRGQLQTLSQRLLQAYETERRHLARELHDEIGQLLTGLRLTLELITRLPPRDQATRLVEAQVAVQELIARVRSLSLNLRPAMLDDMGLLAALLWHFRRYTEQTAITVECRHRNVDQRFPATVEIVAYRVVQEALTNVARHAGVTTVDVWLLATPEQLTVRISDTGRGFDPTAELERGDSSGLLGMRERAMLLGGSLTITSHLGGGTQVLADIPLKEGVEGADLDDYDRSC